jgi:signal transduction histidine kinase
MSSRASLSGRDPLRAAAVVLVVVLLALGTLQYQWLREVADAQRQRMRADAAARAAGIAQDFDREITRAYLLLSLDAASVDSHDLARYAERYQEYRQKSRWPGLVRDVLVSERGADGAFGLLRFSPETKRLEAMAAPPESDPLRRALEAERAGRPMSSVLPEVPALVVPVTEMIAGPPGDAVQRVVQFRARTDPRGRSALLVLDRTVIVERMLPELIAARLGAEARPEYQASVIDSERATPILGPAASGDGDARAELLRLRLEDLDAEVFRAFLPQLPRVAGSHHVALRLVEGVGPLRHRAAGAWRLVLRHEQGSVDQAVAAALRRNLAIAFSVLALLGASVALVAASARRARSLAARQMEFVASVSHELRTPLAVIRSAGDNLADGVVGDPAQVRRYGELVRDVGLRLSETVEQVLSFAGADAPARPAQPVPLPDVIERALRAEAPSLHVEREIAPGLPPVLGDAQALERAVANLVANARKHGGPEPQIAVRVFGVPEGAPRELRISVADRGPGIPDEERERLFEPFFRGRAARLAQVPGSGLGLAVVRRVAEAHGGRAFVEPREGGGSLFTLVLPAAAPRAEPAPGAEAHPAR